MVSFRLFSSFHIVLYRAPAIKQISRLWRYSILYAIEVFDRYIVYRGRYAELGKSRRPTVRRWKKDIGWSTFFNNIWAVFDIFLLDNAC
jgi:hypothetical protein